MKCKSVGTTVPRWQHFGLSFLWLPVEEILPSSWEPGYDMQNGGDHRATLATLRAVNSLASG